GLEDGGPLVHADKAFVLVVEVDVDSQFAAWPGLVVQRPGEVQRVVDDAPASKLVLRLAPAFRVAVGQDGDKVATGPQGRGEEGEEGRLLVQQAVQVQANTHGPRLPTRRVWDDCLAADQGRDREVAGDCPEVRLRGQITTLTMRYTAVHLES